METLALTKTFRFDETCQEQFATYHWGDLAISEFDNVIWRGTVYEVTTKDNPFDFVPTLDTAVMTLYCLDAWPPVFGARQQVEWWAQQQPGHLLGLEVKEDGFMVAEVWTGLMSAWGTKHMPTLTSTPQNLLAHWDELVSMFNGDVSVFTERRMLGPVGMITEVQPYAGEKFDSDFWRNALHGDE